MQQRRRKPGVEGQDGPTPGSAADSTPEADPHSVARAIILRQLTSSAKSRKQLADKLAERDVPEDVAEAVLDRFEEVQLIDDAEFARMWVRSRSQTRSLARSAIRRELAGKGIDPELAEEALEQISTDDEVEAARDLVERKLRRATVPARPQGAGQAGSQAGFHARPQGLLAFAGFLGGQRGPRAHGRTASCKSAAQARAIVPYAVITMFTVRLLGRKLHSPALTAATAGVLAATLLVGVPSACRSGVPVMGRNLSGEVRHRLLPRNRSGNSKNTWTASMTKQGISAMLPCPHRAATTSFGPSWKPAMHAWRSWRHSAAPHRHVRAS